MEDFYNAMTTYINSKKPKEICYHERTIKKDGWKTCVDCCLRLSRIFCDDLYSVLRGYIIKPKEDRLPKIRQIMIEMTRSITKQKAGSPRELFDHLEELCRACLKHETNIKCHRRSLCAALLWEKAKSLYPSLMTLTKFSKKVGVSMTTIKKLIKEPRNH